HRFREQYLGSPLLEYTGRQGSAEELNFCAGWSGHSIDELASVQDKHTGELGMRYSHQPDPGVDLRRWRCGHTLPVSSDVLDMSAQNCYGKHRCRRLDHDGPPIRH